MIQKYSRFYSVFKQYVYFIHSLFYRKIYVEGLENIPNDTPVIFSPNHQNALMDPLALILNVPYQPVFLARADIFKSAINRPILRALKILPVYRVRDGLKNLEHNDSTFDESIGVLEARKQLALFPEARHHGKNYLLPLKKGIPRIAFLAEQKNSFELNLHIVPVGIHYSDYYSYKSDLWVRIGSPIMVKHFEEHFEANPQKAHLDLKDSIAAAIKPLILNIEDTENHDAWHLIIALAQSELWPKKSNSNENTTPLHVQQQIVSSVENLKDEERAKLLTLSNDLLRELNEKGLTPEDITDEQKVSILDYMQLILTFPLFLAGIIPSLPHIIAPWFFYRKLTDRQFESSYKFIFMLLLSPLAYGFTSFYLLPKLLDVNIYIAIGSFFLFFYLGSYALSYLKLVQKIFRNILNAGKRKSVLELKTDLIKTITKFLM